MASIKGIPLSKVSPAFLHANSTSHTWAFSAFAELIDNAYDPDVSASELLIDKVDIRGVPCLIFLDNGAGMDSDHLLKMLSFGFCEKDIYERQGSHQPIGHYGNGFKSGSMRIGQDALVFTRCQKSASIGFLSQTYLKAIQTDSVMVPILEYRLPHLERIKSQESRNNLNAILEYSVFKLESELKEELKALEGSKTGTKIIIYHLKKLQGNTCELDFSSDPTDIRCPEAHEADMTSVYHRPIQYNTSEYKRSLREYCSILFLRPRMKITIRGVRVKSKLISKSLSNTEIDMYKPTWLSRPVKIIFGFTCEAQRSDDCDYGMMLYHRNRLIKAFEKVGYQKQPNGLGVGVVGVAQVDFLQPIHNKQDFNKDEKFNSVMAAFALKLNDYWNEKKGSNGQSAAPAIRNLPDWLWAQCDHCLKWRRLPDEIDRESLPELWFCRMNPDATHNRCDIPEEPEDEDLAVRPTYEKTFKRKQEERKRLQQMEREKEEDIKRRKIMEKERELKQKEATLRAIQQVAAAQPLQECRTVMSLQKALAESRRREEQQKRLILQIQVQKKAIEEQRNSLLMMAENLQASKGKSNEEVLKQISQLLSTLNSSSVPSSPTVLGKRASSEESSTRTTRSGKKVCIKTETGEVLSITENDIEAADDDIDTSQHPPASSPRKQFNGSKQNTPTVKVETQKNSSVVSPLKPAQASPSASSSSKSPSTKNTKQTHVADSGLSEAASSSPVKAGRKRQQKGAVVAVIDLTSDSEFGEVVDMKPDLGELRTTLQESLQQEEADIKPDKENLDKVIGDKDDLKKESETTPDVAETKTEITEVTSQDTTPLLPKKVPDSASADGSNSETKKTIAAGHSEDDPESTEQIPETFQDNIEAAIAVIQNRLERERLNQENEDSVNQENRNPLNQENMNSDNSRKGGEDIIKDEIQEESIKEKLDDRNDIKAEKITALSVEDSGAGSDSLAEGTSEVADSVRESADESSDNNKNKTCAGGSTVEYLLPKDDNNGDDDGNDNDDHDCSNSVSDDHADDYGDYRDHSEDDDKEGTCESDTDKKKCNDVSGSTRSNSLEDGSRGSDGLDIDAESSLRRGNAESPDLQSEKHNEINYSEPNPTVCFKDKLAFEPQRRGEDNSADSLTEEENGKEIGRDGQSEVFCSSLSNNGKRTEEAEKICAVNSLVMDKMAFLEQNIQKDACELLKNNSIQQNEEPENNKVQFEHLSEEDSSVESVHASEHSSTDPVMTGSSATGNPTDSDKCSTFHSKRHDLEQISEQMTGGHGASEEYSDGECSSDVSRDDDDDENDDGDYNEEDVRKPASPEENDHTLSDFQSEPPTQVSVITEDIDDSSQNDTSDSFHNDISGQVNYGVENKAELENQRTLIKFKGKQGARNMDLMCHQQVQTDLDMTALKDILRCEDSLVIGELNHQDILSNKEHCINRDGIYKSFPTLDLLKTAEAEAQTEHWSHSESSLEESESIKDLRSKISLKNQLLKEMEDRIAETQANIHKLLGLVVPGANLGDVSNIDQVVKDMIKSNGELSQFLTDENSENT